MALLPVKKPEAFIEWKSYCGRTCVDIKQFGFTFDVTVGSD